MIYQLLLSLPLPKKQVGYLNAVPFLQGFQLGKDVGIPKGNFNRIIMIIGIEWLLLLGIRVVVVYIGYN